MNELKQTNVVNMIYEIRGKQVMLDSDLAILYNVETKRINEAVRRNLEKFPVRFSWVLSDEEENNLRSQNATSNMNNNLGGRRYRVRVFTEQGVAMLATILKSPIATQVSIAIMDAFIAMRHTFFNTYNTFEYKLLEHDKRISILENTFNNFKEKTNNLFFEGQIYDAYSLLINIFETSKKSIIIIDNYIDKKLLDIIRQTNKTIKIFSSNINEDLIKKYKLQYNNLEIYETNDFHDRFIIIDNLKVYHCGASFKDLGKKCFAINKTEDKDFIEQLINKIKKLT